LPANGQQSARRAFKLAAQDRHYWIGKAKQIRVTLCLRGVVCRPVSRRLFCGSAAAHPRPRRHRRPAAKARGVVHLTCATPGHGLIFSLPRRRAVRFNLGVSAPTDIDGLFPERAGAARRATSPCPVILHGKWHRVLHIWRRKAPSGGPDTKLSHATSTTAAVTSGIGALARFFLITSHAPAREPRYLSAR
jgi:hypothetical protein